MEALDTANSVRTVTRLLRDASDCYADRAAIRYVSEGAIREHSYRDLYRDSLRVCGAIQQRFPAGTHIALIGKTSYRYLIALNAVMMSGCTAVPLAADAPTEETIRLLRDSDAAVIFYDETLRDAENVFSACPLLRDRFDLNAYPLETLPAPETATPREIPEGCAAIIYTSGSTGVRKGAMLTSSAIVSNVYFKEMTFEGGHVALNVLPMHHIFSFSCDYLKNLKDGVTVCLNSRLSALGEELLLFEPTVLRLVPAIIDSLLRRVRILRKRAPSLSPRAAAERVFGRRLRNIIVSGASYSAANDAEFQEMGITIRQGYGMTETGPRIAVPDGGTCAASGGRIISICQVRLQNGEIQVKSPSLMTGYYKREEETKQAFTEDGWFRTGDIGRITEDNELFITGRLKNVIILPNGENVSPEEIELRYAAEPLVKEIEVFEHKGRIAAEIVPDRDYAARMGMDAEDAVRALVEEKNAADIAAREIEDITFRDQPLEKTETGKLKRRKWTL